MKKFIAVIVLFILSLLTHILGYEVLAFCFAFLCAVNLLSCVINPNNNEK